MHDDMRSIYTPIPRFTADVIPLHSYGTVCMVMVLFQQLVQAHIIFRMDCKDGLSFGHTTYSIYVLIVSSGSFIFLRLGLRDHGSAIIGLLVVAT